jgi:hypothetical protein
LNIIKDNTVALNPYTPATRHHGLLKEFVIGSALSFSNHFNNIIIHVPFLLNLPPEVDPEVA